jgi:hypothetical protein
MGFSYPTVLQWSRKPLYRAYETFLADRYYDALPLERKRSLAEVHQKYVDEAGEMQDRLLAILEVADNKLATQIAQDWLDRAGAGPRREAERGLTMKLTDEQVEAIFGRAREAGLPDIVVSEVKHSSEVKQIVSVSTHSSEE